MEVRIYKCLSITVFLRYNRYSYFFSIRENGEYNMDQAHYAKLINEELNNLPIYVKEFYLAKNLSLTTKYQYLTEIRRFFTWLIQENLSQASSCKEIELKTLENLKREDVMLYIDSLRNKLNKQNKYNSPTTINRSINALRSLFHYLTVIADNNNGEPYFYRNVMAKIESLPASQTLNYRANEIQAHMYRGQMKHDFLNFLEERYEKENNGYVVGHFRKNKERDIALIALMLGTGVRVQEAANTNLKDLNVKQGMLSVTRKGGQRDAVPIARWVVPYLVDYLEVRSKRYNPTEDQKALFLTTYRGKAKRITSNAIESFVSKYSESFGRRLTPHKLRHTLASELYSETKDKVLVSQQLGQRGTSATDLYTHVDQTKQKDALNNIK